MTEKRFIIEIWQEGSLFYMDDKEGFSTHNSMGHVINLVESKLNELNDENEQLKEKIQYIQKDIDNSIQRNKEAIEWGENTGASVGAMGFYTHMLEKMKKEWFE